MLKNLENVIEINRLLLLKNHKYYTLTKHINVLQISLCKHYFIGHLTFAFTL